MADLTQMRNFHLKVIFLLYVMFMSFATSGFWTPTSYFFYNSVVLALLIWGLISNSEEPIQLVFVTLGFSIILDIFVLALHFPSQGGSNWFAAIMAVIFWISKPVMCLLLRKIVQERLGSTDPITNIGDIFASSHNRNYEDLDKAGPHPNDSQGGYNFTTAQQI